LLLSPKELLRRKESLRRGFAPQMEAPDRTSSASMKERVAPQTQQALPKL